MTCYAPCSIKSNEFSASWRLLPMMHINNFGRAQTCVCVTAGFRPLPTLVLLRATSNALVADVEACGHEVPAMHPMDYPAAYLELIYTSAWLFLLCLGWLINHRN